MEIWGDASAPSAFRCCRSPGANVRTETMNHTELPWRVDDDSARYDHPSHAPRIVSDLKHIAEVCNAEDWGTAGEEWRANAAYIVQACNAYPRLCEVLRELVDAVDEQQDGLDPTVRLVQAVRDAKSWVDSPALSSSSPKET